ncbi:MAG: hypothetical protein KAR56_00040 [Thermoplasmata archaeon]|nr:hypothetical protein [Thermoplasmata archaeon]
MVLKNIDTRAPGVKEVGTPVNNLDIVREHGTYVKCKKCCSTFVMAAGIPESH